MEPWLQDSRGGPSIVHHQHKSHIMHKAQCMQITCTESYPKGSSFTTHASVLIYGLLVCLSW